MRRYATVLTALIAAGCTSHDERVQIAAPSTLVVQPRPSDVPPIARGIPHAADISLVAVTDQGDAALTADLAGGLRLWPTLDGTRTPVPLRFAGDPAQLAIGHAGGLPGSSLEHDLTAIILDRAGGVTLVRVGLDGTVRRTKQLSGTSYVQVAAIDDGFVARTREHSVEWYAFDGTLRGRVVADAGQELLAIAGRHHQAAALVRSGETTAVRYVQLADVLRWDPAIALPGEPRPDTFALAPHVRRIAYADATGMLRIYDTAFALRASPTAGSAFVNPQQTSVGFTDDNTVAIAGTVITWWNPPPPDKGITGAWLSNDAAPPASLSFDSPAGAATDGLVVSAAHGELVLATTSSVHYLGWAAPATGSYQAGLGHVALSTSNAKYTWLDDDLSEAVSFDVHGENGGYVFGRAMGAHHLVALTTYGDLSDVDVIDARDPERRLVLATATSVAETPVGENMVGVREKHTLRRYKIDLDAMTSTEQLPALEIADHSLSRIEIFDPERAHGLAALTFGWERESSERQTLTRYRIVDGKVIVERERDFDGSIVRVDPDGSLAFLDPTGGLRVARDGQVIKKVVFDLESNIVPSADYSRIAMRDRQGNVVLLDDHGTPLWRTPVWHADELMFSPTESRLFVTSVGGVVALDTKTGTRVGQLCGVRFGLHDKLGESSSSNQGSVCEESLIE